MMMKLSSAVQCGSILKAYGVTLSEIFGEVMCIRFNLQGESASKEIIAASLAFLWPYNHNCQYKGYMDAERSLNTLVLLSDANSNRMEKQVTLLFLIPGIGQTRREKMLLRTLI